ncbi:TPA: glycosyltransferase [Vibrio vulnificus]|nr:glycosyltransferase [Vibrio vulnificus]
MVDTVVIMSVYFRDDKDEFERALSSMLNQTVEVDVFLYCDGELNFELESVVESYRCHKSVTIFKNRLNKGLSFGLNYLIDKALEGGYQFIARMDSDDWSYPHRIERQRSYFNDNSNVDVCGTFCKEVGASYALSRKELPTSHGDLYRFSVLRCPFIHPTVLFRRKVFESGIRYPIDTHLTEDMALWFFLLAKGFKFGNVDEVLLDYTLREATILRRSGVKKGISEFVERYRFMVETRQASVKNIFGVTSRLFFHLLPPKLLKFLYRKAR